MCRAASFPYAGAFDCVGLGACFAALVCSGALGYEGLFL